MTDCCSTAKTQSTPNNTSPCPNGATPCRAVKCKTVIQHVKRPWDLVDKDRHYFFCEDPDCDIVYFSDDGLIIRHAELRTKVGVKDTSENATLCYCFGVSRGDALKDPSLKNFVKSRTKQSLCSCETRNPSGLCCLKNFPR